MQILFWSLVFILSLAATILSADYFTRAAEKIGLHFRISPFIIGVTIIAIGTSLPELATSIIAVLHDSSEIVIANVVGSNITNILLILGATAVVGQKLRVDKDIINIDLPLMLSSSILLFLTTLDRHFGYLDAILSLFMLLAYLLYNGKSDRSVQKKSLQEISQLKREVLDWKQPAILIIAGTILYTSANYTIISISTLSELLSIGKEIIAISAVALGTSLPELVVSIIAASKGKADIALGNITGSNIFNALGVMGIPALIGDLRISEEMINFSIPTLIFITILYLFITMDKEISKWEGLALISLYLAFIGKSFALI